MTLQLPQAVAKLISLIVTFTTVLIIVFLLSKIQSLLTQLAVQHQHYVLRKRFLTLLHNLNPAKSTGLDGVSANMLKSTATSIAASLTKLFNMSIATGCFPKDWKPARITPIFKSSDSSLPKNYRSISILPIVSKLLERHVHSLVFRHLLESHPISPFQWGFMPRRSTTSALCSLTHDWLRQLDDGSEICSVFFRCPESI